MGQFIVKLEGKYFEWSTIVDGPITNPMSLDELKALVGERDGSRGLADLDSRLERVERTGFSLHDRSYSLESLLCCNRCGPGERPFTEQELRAWARGEMPLRGAT
jgi:hypothetical protein